MKKDFLDKQKKKLTAERNELIDSLLGRNDQFEKLGGSPENSGGDEVDIASDTIDRTLLNSLGEADQFRLKMIDAALDRIVQGTYGVCLECGTPIADARLEAIPYAPLCVECQAEYERRH